MGKREMEGFRKCPAVGAREEVGKRELTDGGSWYRISYERRDGRVQVQYILFDSRGCVHSIVYGPVSAETQRRYHDVDEAQGIHCGSNSVEFLCDGGWVILRMVR